MPNKGPVGPEHINRKPLRQWASEWGEAISDQMSKEYYYPDDKPVTEWEARVAIARWTGKPIPADPTDQEVEVELTLRAKVKVTAGMRQGLKEQSSRMTEQDMWDTELVAKAMVYASINPMLPQDNKDSDDFFDGVGNMRGLIRDLSLETE